MDVSLGELWELVKDTEAWHAAIQWGHKESGMTEQLNWTELSEEQDPKDTLEGISGMASQTKWYF